MEEKYLYQFLAGPAQPGGPPRGISVVAGSFEQARQKMEKAAAKKFPDALFEPMQMQRAEVDA